MNNLLVIILVVVSFIELFTLNCEPLQLNRSIKNNPKLTERNKKESGQGHNSYLFQSLQKKLDSLGIVNMAYIAGGTFQRGSSIFFDDNVITKNVSVKSFYLSKFEVTVQEFSTFIEETKYITSAEKIGFVVIFNDSTAYMIHGINWKYNTQGKLISKQDYNHPVIFVSWEDAKAYCEWLSKKNHLVFRLPTETEWEFAAGNGRKHTIYSWGNIMPIKEIPENIPDQTLGEISIRYKIFNKYRDAYAFTSPVGSFKQNDYGLYDIGGNVREWCEDIHRPKTGFAYIDTIKKSSHKLMRVTRGGSWGIDTSTCRITCRNYSGFNKISPTNVVGFRVAL